MVKVQLWSSGECGVIAIILKSTLGQSGIICYGPSMENWVGNLLTGRDCPLVFLVIQVGEGSDT